MSEELLSEVLDKEVTNIKMHHINDEYIYFDYIGKQSRLVNEVSIDIYKLAHKCKEWALRNNFCIISATFTSEEDDIEENLIKDVNYAWAELHNEDKLFRADTEPQSIFKACQWILEKQIEEDSQEYKIVTDFTNTYCEVSELHYDELSKLFPNKYQRKSALSFAYFSTSMEGKDCPTFALRGGTSPLATMRAENLTQIHYNTDINEWVFTEDKEEYIKIIEEGVKWK